MKILSTLLCLPFLLASSCESDTPETESELMETEPKPNRLIDETSPYLLQHAYNPVDWYPWGEEAFEKAKAEDKLVLVSIGYSACHWCHVMEQECFENEEVARLMNDHFVCIKVDREERPDVDQIYMDALSQMGQRGGWPLNCFVLPDGRPLWGGTYFPADQWTNVLTQLESAYTNRRDEVLSEAERITNRVQSSSTLVKIEEEVSYTRDEADQTVAAWKDYWDLVEGGPNWAPKFPIPNNFIYLMRYYYHSKDESVLDYVNLTLKKMAFGGIYDQVGGGFARYSTDALWKVPHFEKMLYDNAQLVSLYAEAYQLTGYPLYKQIVEETLLFIEREMTSDEGAFYSAYDADSEGEEGKFYVWSEAELQEVLGNRFNIAEAYFELSNKGEWEGNYILLRDKDLAEVAKGLDMEEADVEMAVNEIKATLYNIRKERVWPGLDDKTLTSWNALMIKGYVDAYRVLGTDKYLDAALINAQFIWDNQLQGNGALNHNYKDGRSTINGYLEDYCFTIEAFISLYEATFNEVWLTRAKTLADYTIAHFYDEASGMFYFTSDLDAALIARKTEIVDNVIPSSNSSMAKALFLLGKYFDEADYQAKSDQMLKNMSTYILGSGRDMSNWGILYLWNAYPYYEVAVAGTNLHEVRVELSREYVPNMLLLGTNAESTLPLLEMKFVEGETRIYVCENAFCLAPVNTADEALEQLQYE